VCSGAALVSEKGAQLIHGLHPEQGVNRAAAIATPRLKTPGHRSKNDSGFDNRD
jgi:hypothetical protein